MNWTLTEKEFDKEKIELLGSKFLQGNGYLGFRGILDEFGKYEKAACIVAGLYDGVKDKWREPVNIPNPLFTTLSCDGIQLSVIETAPVRHEQSLDILRAVHSRKTEYNVSGNTIRVSSERFVSKSNLHLLAAAFTIECEKNCSIILETGIDADVWDINGPHFSSAEFSSSGNILEYRGTVQESGNTVSITVSTCSELPEKEISESDLNIFHKFAFKAEAGRKYTFYRAASVSENSKPDEAMFRESLEICRNFSEASYEKLKAEHISLWEKSWKKSDIEISGDEKAQLALRFSIYHLLSIAPPHNSAFSIPARGLSGQVYKGAVFWDTEMFMLPFFNYTDPETSKSIIRYRISTLDGAKRKAAYYGYAGAYYAWESHENGDDACTHFNITDVFTGRPVRTYFRDKQIHISGDVVKSIFDYISVTGDTSILAEGADRVILECAEFYYSYSVFKKTSNRFEIHDVTGPDEYHERVNNNAYTNRLVRFTMNAAMETLGIVRKNYPKRYKELASSYDLKKLLSNFKDMENNLYMPSPDRISGVIEQFDGYMMLKETTPHELKSQMLHPDEYLGGACGIASATRVIKQADVALMMVLFSDEYSQKEKITNRDFYEPRTEHGSTLSACIYSLLASATGNSRQAYDYFIKTATTDLHGEYRQYIGPQYIGGTHPAANGGAWMAAVHGFCGLHVKDGRLHINPALPEKWEKVKLNISWNSAEFSLTVTDEVITVKATANALKGARIVFKHKEFVHSGEETFEMNI